MYLTNADEMREIDRLTIETFGMPGRLLMENAGRGATRMFLEHFTEIRNSRVAVVAGKGNNGGDGFVMARYLKGYKAKVFVYLLSTIDRITGDAEANIKLLEPIGVPVIEIPDKYAFENEKSSLAHQTIFIDAILGTGLKSTVRGYFSQVIEFINKTGKPVFSVDIPSGLNSETGQKMGNCIKADATATFGFPKTGHILQPGASLTGRLGVVDLGFPDHIVAKVAPGQTLITPSYIKSGFRPRPASAHKGTSGHVLVIAGSLGKTGAAAMASHAALKAGAGLVTLGIPRSLNQILEPMIPEVMTFPLKDTGSGSIDESAGETIISLLPGKACVAMGPGLGLQRSTQNLVRELLPKMELPVVMDADALNSMEGHTDLFKKVNAPLILTPHPGEMARLTGMSLNKVQKDRVGCARDFAREFNLHLVLKGAGTVAAHPDGRVYINCTGNPGMGSAGMGDLLTGIIAGFVAQGYPLEFAIHFGIFLHGASGNSAAYNFGPFGFTASQVIDQLPSQIDEISQNRKKSFSWGGMPEMRGL